MREFGFGAVLAVLMATGAQAAGSALPGWFPVTGLFSLNPDANPLVDNDNAADRARNRRVELTRPNCG